MGYIILIWDKQRMVTMEKKEITAKINTLIEMLYIVGQKKGLTEAGDIFTHRTEAVETKTEMVAANTLESSSSVVMFCCVPFVLKGSRQTSFFFQ